jgi:transcriptional regulator with XRE-family HTH domain
MAGVGHLIRAARREAGLTQAELATRSGTSQATLSSYERGRKDPSASTATRILTAAGAKLATVPAPRPVWTPGGPELERRGRILAEVIDLAERLPSSSPRPLGYPPLRRPAREAP